jgi:hypothetical protein
MTTAMRCIVIAFACVLVVSADAIAQEPCPTNIVLRAVATDATRDLMLTFAEGATLDKTQPPTGSVTVNGTTATVLVEFVEGSFRRLVVKLPQIYAAGTDLQYSVNATFTCTMAAAVVGTIKVESNAGAIDRLLKEISYAKTADEKNIFGSFVAAKGEDGQAAGAADIVVNRDLTAGAAPTVGSLFDTAFTTIKIKKTSAENADPRGFDASVTLQKTLLLGGARQYLLACSQGTTIECLDRADLVASDNALTSFFRAFLFNEALHLESDAFSFESVNFVSDTHLQLGSVAKAVTQDGYFSLRLHGGGEFGRSLQKPSTAAGTSDVNTDTVDWVKRLKAGAELTFKWLPGDNTGTSWAVELSARAVFRRLYADETIIEQITNENNETIPARVQVAKGNRPWREADAKVFLFATDKARYGFRLSYMRGSLPPTYKETKGFTFGFVVETADDRSDNKSANN